MTIEQNIAELVQASNNLTGVVDGKIQDIDKKVTAAENSVNSFVANARDEYPIYRQTKNQYGNLTDTSLDFFSKNSQFNIDISLYREIHSNVEWALRDAEEKEIMTAMGVAGVKHFQPTIRVMKMVWSGFDAGNHSTHSIFPNPIGNGSCAVTIASYAKLISGSISGWWLAGVNDVWGLCGTNRKGAQGRYLHAHPYVSTPFGEVLFIWAGIVSGHVPLDRDAPKWGYWPSMSGDSPFDTEQGV